MSLSHSPSFDTSQPKDSLSLSLILIPAASPSLVLSACRLPLHSPLWIPTRIFCEGLLLYCNASVSLTYPKQQFYHCFSTWHMYVPYKLECKISSLAPAIKSLRPIFILCLQPELVPHPCAFLFCFIPLKCIIHCSVSNIYICIIYRRQI